jgi:transposase
MRVTTLFRRLLGVTGVRVKEVFFQLDEKLTIEVEPRLRQPRCGGCRRRAPGYDRRPLRWWRHLAFGQTVVRLAYAPRRVDCPRCGVRAEWVPWGDPESRFTCAFEELVAYLAQVTDQTQVAKLTGIAWATVGSIVDRIVRRRLGPERFAGLRRIGIDEFSFRKHHRYLTVVVDHDQHRIVWAAEGRNAETLREFFKLVGPRVCAGIELVTIDMSAAYEKAVAECLPHAEIVFDRFHVQRLASDALDEVRRSLVRELRGTKHAAVVKNTRWALLKNPIDLTRADRQQLSGVQQANRPLYRAYLLKETLAGALDYLQPKRANDALIAWLNWASRSRLQPFVKAARTIRAHLPGILAYIRHRLTNGIVEGLNSKLRMINHRAYGFHSAAALIAMLYLTCAGIHLNPPLPVPTSC